MTLENKKSNKAWVVAVAMGYGHERAAYPLRELNEEGVITANNYEGIPDKDRDIWESGRRAYERISRSIHIPVVGKLIFGAFDQLQKILPFYPKRDLSKPSLQLRQIFLTIRKFNWGKDLVKFLKRQKDLPLVTTFFNIAYMAEEFKYPGKVYTVICDADISRVWASLEPPKSKINYFAPNRRVVERLKLYGIKPERIFLTGFPLPEENIGDDLSILKQDLAKRIKVLDPNRIFIRKYEHSLRHYLKTDSWFKKIRVQRPLTITFAVGGAGAQREIGALIIHSLKKDIKRGRAAVNLVAGIRNEVCLFFKEAIKKCGLKEGRGIKIIFDTQKQNYFDKFNKTLRNTDILWTKPSELVFYAGLGIPIIMAPPIGSQEVFNERWLAATGAGIKQQNPRYTNEWLFDWLKNGWFAEAALQGFLDVPKRGAYNIEDIISGRKKKPEDIIELF